MTNNGFHANTEELVEITDCRHIRSQQKGTLGISLKLTCEKGEIGFVNWVTPNTAAMTRKFYRTLGLDPDTTSIGQLDPDHADSVVGQVLGKPVVAVLREEEYDGQTRVKCAFINSPKVKVDAGKDEIKKLDALIRAAKKDDGKTRGQQIADNAPF